ncbi:MAG: serine protease [Hymenobacteraceae bacterium]|mgnify:CR=1 FL=1|nr:serine protease [Hymenobacteraceae bacterium]MDX5394718.1 serine protease [Hymenobacteraceae bacterium]MDX5442519.1 serine protease [Hymenobacteraceae bacterium]MDX5510751.1 serine protease [Hymenobacteraceae bacterium]
MAAATAAFTMTDYNHLEAIEDYLHDRMSAEARASFEQAMLSDPVLAQQVQEHRLLLQSLRQFGRRKSLKKKLNLIHAEMEAEQQPEEQVRKLPNGWKVFYSRHASTMAVAASVAVLTFLATWFSVNALRPQVKQPAGYVELRREVQAIKQTQEALIQDIIGSEAVKPPVVNPGQFSGTGFALTSDGYIITSYHVVEGADSLLIEHKNGTQYKVTEIYKNEANDLAILKVSDPAFTSFGKLPFTVKQAEPDLGEKVFTLGHPREDVVYGEGSISAHTGFNNDTTAYQISIPLNPGNSGGPLLDDKGNLVGVISGKQMGLEGASFAVKSGYLLNLLEQLPKTQQEVILPKQNQLNGQPRPAQLKKLKDYVFMVKVYNQPQ